MKLICEYRNTDLECITESDTQGSKKFYIEGIYAQSERINRNGRFYPKSIMEQGIGNYINDQVKKNRAVGELNHPEGPTVNLDKVSHRIVDLKFESNDVVGKSLVLDTPMGNILKGLMEGGFVPGVSTRAMGSLTKKGNVSYVGEDLIFTAIDVVQDPSAHEAFVNGIMEGVDFFFKNGEIVSEISERYKEKMNTMSVKKINESQLKLYKDFLNEVSFSL